MSSTKYKCVRFGSQSVKSSARSCSTRSGSKATKKVKVKKKPEWDTTVSDLTVHKLSKEELEKRRQNFQSRNAEVAKHDLYEKAKGSFDLDSSGNLRPSPLVVGGASSHNRKRSSSKLAVLQQSLHGKELHDVLAESDRALAVVRDLFGDDPKRYTCQPNVTVAPHIISDKGKLERTILESSECGPTPTVMASPGGIRDESVFELAPKKLALNDLASPPPDDTTMTADMSERAESPTISFHSRDYQPAIDLTRFQELIDSEERSYGHKNANIMPSQCTSHAESVNEEHQFVHGNHHAHREMQRKAKSNNLGSRQLNAGEVRPDSGEHLPEQEDVREEVDNSSVEGMSELSSIPQETDERENTTIDSEVSSVHPHIDSGHLKQKAQASVASGKRVDKSRGTAQEPVRMMSQTPSHPLHVVHRMAPRLEKADDQGEHVHNQIYDLEQMVQQLERELATYEKSSNLTMSLNDITNSPASIHHKLKNGGTLSSITKSLLTSMTKMMSYLRQSEVQLKGEVAVRVQLLQTMTEQQNLMDSLTADLIKLRSENISLRQELVDLKKSSSEQIRKIQDDFADVHKKLSSLAVSQAHHVPPSHAYSYLSPRLPLLPPHLLQTPPPFPSSESPVPDQNQYHDIIPHKQHQSPLPTRTSVTPTNVEAVHTNASGIELSQAQPHTTLGKDSPECCSYQGKENEQNSPDHETTSPQIGNLKSGTKHAHFETNVQSEHTSSMYAESLPNVTAVPSLAPPPPSLSVALQVPGFDMPSYLTQQQASNSATTTATLTLSTPTSKPAFDVEAFIDSLRRNQAQLGTTVGSSDFRSILPVSTKQSDLPAHQSAGVRFMAPSSLHAAQSDVLLQLQPSVCNPLPSVTTPSLNTESIMAAKVDLSRLSSGQGEDPGEIGHEDDREGDPSTGTELDIPHRLGEWQKPMVNPLSQQNTRTGSTRGISSTAMPPQQNNIQQSLCSDTPTTDSSKTTSTSGIAATVPTSLHPEQVSQRHLLPTRYSSKPKPGWFALSSHLSHS